MGVDASWHLRFGRKDKQVFWVQPKVVPQLENILYIEPDWTLTQTRVGDVIRAEFVRTKKT